MELKDKMIGTRVLRLLNYVIASMGLSLLVLAGTIPLIEYRFADYYNPVVKSIFRNFGFEGLPFWEIPLSHTVPTIAITLVGFLIWLPSWSLLKHYKDLDCLGIELRLYAYWAILLAGVGILGDLFVLGFFSLITMLGLMDTYISTSERSLYFLFLLLLCGLIFGHIILTLFIIRYHLEVTSRVQANSIKHNGLQPHA